MPNRAANCKRPGTALVWALGALASAAGGVVLVYCLRVFYSLDTRGFAALPLFAGGALGGLALVAAIRGILLLKTPEARAVACILLTGAVFCFANPPMQAPDEYNHYLRSYAISCGHFDFDASRTYPQDVSRLYQAFPGAWVSAHTSQGLTIDDAGNTVTYNSEGYALKQRGEDGRVESVLDSFAEYFAGAEAEPVTEPILFMVVPFLPQALGMALARLAGLGALGCLYGGRLANLLVYAALCYAALKICKNARGIFAAVMLCPLSVYMAASLSYDAQLLGCYYLCAACLFTGDSVLSHRRLFAFGAAFVYMNIAKPYVNLLWLLLLPFLPAVSEKHPRRRKALFAALLLALALAVSAFTEWYGVAARANYGTIGRMLGDDVQQVPQLLFMLRYPLRYLAVFAGTLYENNFFIGQLGVFGALDLPIPLLNLLCPAVLLLCAVLSGTAGTGLKARLGGTLFALVYSAAVAAAMYITYTPVGMVRIIGLQARYFLPAFLLLFAAAGSACCHVLQPQGTAEKRQNAAIALAGATALLGALLLAMHYYLGPVYLIR